LRDLLVKIASGVNMNMIKPRLSLFLSATALTVVGTGMSAQAGTLPTPTPGTAATSAAALSQAETLTPQLAEPAAETGAPIAQVPGDLDPGQATRGGSSYIGVAGNIGIGGNTALSDGNFMVISKIGFTNVLSLRPSVIIADDPMILVPITYDFNIQQAEPFQEVLSVAPYAGAGVAISTGDDSTAGVLLTGGVDVPLNPQFTATAALNLSFVDDTDVGILVGIGYNFAGF